ncbi:hypothetical protein KUCAC02_032026, partial [Chaenocephalus aceratus]
VGKSTIVAFSAFLNGRYPAADLSGYVTVSYSSPTGKHTLTHTYHTHTFHAGSRLCLHLRAFSIGSPPAICFSFTFAGNPLQPIKSELNLPDSYHHSLKRNQDWFGSPLSSCGAFRVCGTLNKVDPECLCISTSREEEASQGIPSSRPTPESSIAAYNNLCVCGLLFNLSLFLLFLSAELNPQ